MSERPHYEGHRDRLRARFRQSGLKGMHDYEAIELMLFWAIPRRDIKPVAKALVKRFGGFRGVLDALHEDLLAVPGVGEGAATFLAALKESAALYLRGEVLSPGRTLSNIGAVLDYCTIAMSGLRDEQLRAIFLNSSNEVVGDEIIQEGTVNRTAVFPRKVIEQALRHNATAMILVHNHPGGSCKPSAEDKAITLEITRVARGLDLALHDHIIVCRNGHFSFRDHGLLR